VFSHVAAIARDWSLIILIVPALIMLGVQAYLLWHVNRALRRFGPRVRPALRSVQETVLRAAGTVDAARQQAERPFVWLRVWPAQVRGTWRAVVGGRQPRR